MWEGDVCCNHPRNPLQGDEIKTRLGEGLAGNQRLDPHYSQFITSYLSSVSVSTVGFLKTVVHIWCYFHTCPPIFVTQIDLGEPAVASSLWSNCWFQDSEWVLLCTKDGTHEKCHPIYIQAHECSEIITSGMWAFIFQWKKVDGGDELNINIEQMIRAHWSKND